MRAVVHPRLVDHLQRLRLGDVAELLDAVVAEAARRAPTSLDVREPVLKQEIDTELVGVATIMLRDAQHLASLEVVGDAVVLTMMQYAEELVDLGEYRFPTGVQIRKPELQMARTLVEQLAARWDPAQFTDEYGENLMRIIRARMKGKTVSLPARADEPPAEVVDLVERLRQSLAQTGTARRKTKARAGRQPAAQRSGGPPDRLKTGTGSRRAPAA